MLPLLFEEGFGGVRNHGHVFASYPPPAIEPAHGASSPLNLPAYVTPALVLSQFEGVSGPGGSVVASPLWHPQVYGGLGGAAPHN